MSLRQPIFQKDSSASSENEVSQTAGRTLAAPAFQLAASAEETNFHRKNGQGANVDETMGKVVQAKMMDIHGRSNSRMSREDIITIQERLLEIGLLDIGEGCESPEDWEWGVIENGGQTEQAISLFQEQHSEEISDIESANLGILANDARNISGLQERLRNAASTQSRDSLERQVAVARQRGSRQLGVSRHEDGELAAGDPTHQVLANSWPRQIGGTLLRNEAEAYEFIAAKVEERDLPFDRSRVNIIGVRGFSSGQANGNPGVRLRTNTLNDTFFVLAIDDQGEAHVREFPGTTDPGARRSAGEGNQDPNTYQMESGQQLPFSFNSNDTSKMGRPTLTPMTGTEAQGTVIDPLRSQGDSDMSIAPPNHGENPGLVFPPNRGQGRVLHLLYGQGDGRRNLQRGEHSSDDQAGHRSVAGPEMHPTLRTNHGLNAAQRGKRRGIAIHSSNAGDVVNADSTGCQVIHGNWYGNFIMTLQRGLTWERLRYANGLSEEDRAALPRNFIPDDAQELTNRGAVIYSFLNARDLQ